jgi:tetratricopeptide (TPR) repeat protein
VGGSIAINAGKKDTTLPVPKASCPISSAKDRGAAAMFRFQPTLSMSGIVLIASLNAVLIIAVGQLAFAQSNPNCFNAKMPPRDIISACNQVIDADAQHAQAHLSRGSAWYKLRDYDRAISDFSLSIGIDPNYVRAFYNRGLAFEKKGKLQDALADFIYFAQLDPSYPDTQSAITRVTLALKAGPSNVARKPVGTAAELENISMGKSGGVYVVYVRFNDTITLPAIVDSGAADVSVPADIVSTLMRTNTITDEDFLGQSPFGQEGSCTPWRLGQDA